MLGGCGKAEEKSDDQDAHLVLGLLFFFIGFVLGLMCFFSQFLCF